MVMSSVLVGCDWCSGQCKCYRNFFLLQDSLGERRHMVPATQQGLLCASTVCWDSARIVVRFAMDRVGTAADGGCYYNKIM
jgi:hypothetical protein